MVGADGDGWYHSTGLPVLCQSEVNSWQGFPKVVKAGLDGNADEGMAGLAHCGPVVLRLKVNGRRRAPIDHHVNHAQIEARQDGGEWPACLVWLKRRVGQCRTVGRKSRGFSCVTSPIAWMGSVAPIASPALR